MITDNAFKITEKIDAITKIPESHRGTIIPAPPSVKIELTARCDLQCYFCGTPQKLRKQSDMDFEFLRRILTEMKEAGVKEIGLFYLGESLLYPRLVDAIKMTKEMGFEHIFLTTNGRLLKQTKAYDIFRAGLDSLKFSFNSANAEDFKHTTKCDAFDILVQNIKDAKYIRDKVFETYGHKCGLYASSIYHNTEQSEKMAPALAEIKPYLDEHYWLPLYNQAGFTQGFEGNTPTENDKNKSVRGGNPGRLGAMRESLPCWVLFTEGHVTWDGQLTGCSFSHESQWDFGDLNSESFMEAWNSDKAQALRQANLNQDVSNCACKDCIYHECLK